MITKTLKVNNFQLLSKVDLTFGKINLISGQNLDTLNSSGNGSGKSTLGLSAILFALYGEVQGINLIDLITFGKKETKVEIELEKDGHAYKIIREIPLKLSVYEDGQLKQFNTATLTQNYINSIFKDVQFFRQFRTVDLNKGINILDLATISLRKTMMGFLEDIFTEIRNRLLAKKAERERYSVDKKLYKHYLSMKRLEVLNASLDEIKKDYERFGNEREILQGNINKIRGDIQSKFSIIKYKEADLKKVDEGICPILKIKCEKIAPKNKPNLLGIQTEIDNLNEEIHNHRKQLDSEEESMGYYKDTLFVIEKKEQRAREWLLKLKSAFQFSDYKYTKADIIIYDEAIKILDNFAGVYIKEWLHSLQEIINQLLNSVNLSVEFTEDKSFIKVFDNTQELKYSQLSTGQKTFLCAIFKLGILMQKEETGLVILDDGLNSMDETNFKNFIEICKGLPFQIIAIYQDCPDIEGVNKINIIRKNGASYVKS